MRLIKASQHDFPILKQTVYDQPLVYLDNAATTQKPQPVLDRLIDYYQQSNSNTHRGEHYLAEQASAAYEQARTTVQNFINAKKSEEIIFTRGTTEAINLVASTFGQAFIKPGDELIISQMEHHSNFLPWQAMCQRQGATLKVLPLDNQGKLQVDKLSDLITTKTRLIALTYVSNALGIVNPIKSIIDLAHKHNVPVLIDAAQAIQHGPIDVQALDCDFLAFSGHKMYGPTGIGVLYGKTKLLNDLPPYQYGGGMIASVSLDQTIYAPLPFKFEAGTGNIASAIGLGAAIEYVQSIGLDNIISHEHVLMNYGLEKLSGLDEVELYGPGQEQVGVISFNLKHAHPVDVGMILDKQGIIVRTGTHCAQPLMDHLGVTGTVRASFGLYNSKDDIDRLITGIKRACSMLCSETVGIR